MVQILPSRTNAGTQIGQALGMGLSKGMEQGTNIGVQRGMLNQAFDQAQQAFTPQIDPNTGEPMPVDPTQASFQAIKALLAGGGDRAIAGVLPILLGNLRNQNLYGKKGQGGAPGMPGGEPPTEQEASRIASQFVSGAEGRGFLTPIWNPEQKQQYAAEYARQLGDPAAFDRGLAQAESISQSGMESRNYLQQAALNQGITPEEMPRFMQSAQQISENPKYKDLAAIERAAINETKKIRNQKESLQNINVPGAAQKLTGGVAGKVLAGTPYPLYQALAEGGKRREAALKPYKEAVKNLVDQGEEPFVRETLATKGLSPTEVEEMIHPLKGFQLKEAAAMPFAAKMTPKKQEERLTEFFKDNVANNTSLLVLRDFLIKKRQYGWEEINRAISKAYPGGTGLTDYQNAELIELGVAPRQSLSEIFSGKNPNLRGFLRGEK